MTPLNCPACKGEKLVALQDGETKLEVDTCSKCLGVWFDASELSKFYQSEELKQRLTPVGGGGVHHTYEISTTARRCPRCSESMERPYVGGIAIDVCKSCRGVWFDDGELRKITEIHQSRGLKGDEIVTEQVRDGMSKKSGGKFVVLTWFLNSFLRRES